MLWMEEGWDVPLQATELQNVLVPVERRLVLFSPVVRLVKVSLEASPVFHGRKRFWSSLVSPAPWPEL